LSEDERVLIADRIRAGASLRAIGRELVRPASTVSREVRRNRDEVGRYRPFTAHRMGSAASGSTVDQSPRRSSGQRGCRTSRAAPAPRYAAIMAGTINTNSVAAPPTPAWPPGRAAQQLAVRAQRRIDPDRGYLTVAERAHGRSGVGGRVGVDTNEHHRG
jgi:hypothetical protein